MSTTGPDTPLTLEVCQQRAAGLVVLAQSLVVDSQESADAAGRLVADIRRAEKVIDDYHEKPIKAAWDQHKFLLGQAKAMKAEFAPARAIIDPKILAFRRAQEAAALEAARLEDERRRREAEDELLAKAAAMEAAGYARTAETMLNATPQVAPTKVVPPKTEGVSEVRTWHFRVVDAALVPPKFLAACPKCGSMVPNGKMLQSYASALKDQAQLEGVEFYPESSLAARSSEPRARVEVNEIEWEDEDG